VDGLGLGKNPPKKKTSIDEKRLYTTNVERKNTVTKTLVKLLTRDDDRVRTQEIVIKKTNQKKKKNF